MNGLVTWYVANKDLLDLVSKGAAFLASAYVFWKWAWPKLNGIFERVNFQNLLSRGVALIVIDQECLWSHTTSNDKTTTQVSIHCYVTNSTKKDLKILKAAYCNRLGLNSGISFIASNGYATTFNTNWIVADETVKLNIDLFFDPPLDKPAGLLAGKLVLWDQFNKKYYLKVICKQYGT